MTPVAHSAPLRARRRLVRRAALGSEALYALLEEGGEVVTAEVISAPGLAAGSRIRLMASAVAAMERLPAAPAITHRQPARAQ
jgi:hypothetical protein